jgi:mono/diheme cytochrome c family protein
MDAALSGLRGSEILVLDRLLAAQGGTTPQREAAVTMLAATVVRGGQDAAVQRVLTRIADDGGAGWQRAALMRGAEVAVLGAAMPGGTGRRGGGAPAANAPCPTCPGARGGPGGAYAFRQVAPPPVVGEGRGGGPRTVRLNSEPAGLTALPAKGGELGPRATALLARIEWPGKPGAAAPVAPLTAAEQQRFTAGQEVYRNVCQACHQADGRGAERLAPSLIESGFALGPPEIQVRILLHGKEGTTGLMPPVGQVFTDEQIAAVLTYIRREWGQPGSAVEAGTVKAVRSATAGRSRPWTDPELNALGKGAQ